MEGMIVSEVLMSSSQLAIQHMITPYLIKTPGGKISTNQLVRTPLSIWEARNTKIV
jgi:hypothetical protein